MEENSVFAPVEVIFDEEPYDIDVDPSNEERELPFCDEPQVPHYRGDGHDHG